MGDSFDIEWRGDELRPDMRKVITEWLHNPSETNTDVTHKEDVTVQWIIQSSVPIDFSIIKATLNLTYSESRTYGNTYKGNIGSKQTGRMIYIPNMHCIKGWITTYRWEMVGDVLVQGDVNLDHVRNEVYFPIKRLSS